MSSWTNDLSYILMNARKAPQGLEREYELAYKCWRDAWEKYRSEVKVEGKLHSDSFMIADEIGAVFYQGKCVGFSEFTFGNMKDPTILDHSYFKGWTENALQGIANISSQVVLCSQFTVGPEFTGKNHTVRWKEIVSLMTLLRFQRSVSGVMAGQLNLVRKMNDAAGESFGATILEPCLEYHYFPGSTVQLVAYEKEKISKMIEDKKLQDLCATLWSKLRHHSDQAVVPYDDENLLTFAA